MKKSKVYHVMVRPHVLCGIAKDFAIFSFVISLTIGSSLGFLVVGNGIGVLLGIALFAIVLCTIGLILTHIDPEFFTVIIRNVFRIGERVRVDGKRHYEP